MTVLSRSTDAPGPTAAAAARPTHRAVASPEAGRSLTLLVVAFGVTVVVTRLYLMLSGYPQIGGGYFHIAHALWGGLLLVVGSVLPLLWSNRWVPTTAALCSGAGVGLFIDEVGKYITTANDYFSPLAAPIIYLAFLCLLLLARRASRPRDWDARAQGYVVLQELTGLVDGHLDARTRADLLHRLDLLRASGRPDLAELAERLTPLVEAAPVVDAPRDGAGADDAPVPVANGWSDRTLAVLRATEARLLPRWVHRLLLAVGALLVGVCSLVGLVVMLALVLDDAVLVIDDRTVPKGSQPPMLWVAAAGQTLIGVVLVVAAVLLFLARDRIGTALVRGATLFGLAGVNVALGYESAETVVVVVVLELIGLGLCVRYRRRFLEVPGSARDPRPAGDSRPASPPTGQGRTSNLPVVARLSRSRKAPTASSSR